MREMLMLARLAVLVLLLAHAPAVATGVPRALSQVVLQMPDSLRARMLVSIAQGDVAGAVAMWELQMGREAPRWLLAFQNAFNAANQRAGPCMEVAKAVFGGFKRLGSNPSYVRFSAQGSRFLGFETRSGDPKSTIQVSELRVHVAVQVENRLYDAFTGPGGLPTSEYVKRLVTEEGATITSQMVESL